jgi:hypothetical protein
VEVGTELVIGNIFQMLAVWGPISLLFIVALRLLWRAGDRRPNRDLLVGQQLLQTQVDALTQEVRDLKALLRGSGAAG